MKKMTIALFTAAAMGTSAFAVADEHGPEFSGRVNLDIRNVEGAEADMTRGNADRLIVSGSGDLAAGLSGRYYVRFEDTEAASSRDINDFQTDKAYYAVSGSAGEVLFGRDDDIVYKFVGVRTDVPWGNLGGVPDAATTSDTFSDRSSAVQYQVGFDALTFGAYVDTKPVETGGTTNADGFNNMQLGVQGDFGLLSAGFVYSDSEDDGRDDELAFGATLNLDVATISATARDDSLGNNPVSVVAGVPLQNGMSAYGAYGDNDQDGSDNEAHYLLGVSADLGSGFVTYLEFQNEADDENNSGFVLGGNFSF